MTTPEIIKPTVGRKVWFRNNGSMQKLPRADGGTAHPVFCGIEQPMDATVIFVHGARMVNLDITDHIGQRFVATSVPLLQDDDAIPDMGFYCEWMPYQKGQAAKDASTALPVVDLGPDSLEREIQAKAAKGPRVTPADIEAEIVSEHYFTAEDGVFGALHTTIDDVKSRPATLGLLTFCVLMLRNGTKVVGINYGAIDPAQHCAEMGRKEARAQAVEKVWELLGFRLRDELARPVLTEADAAADLAGTPRPSQVGAGK